MFLIQSGCLSFVAVFFHNLLGTPSVTFWLVEFPQYLSHFVCNTLYTTHLLFFLHHTLYYLVLSMRSVLLCTQFIPLFIILCELFTIFPPYCLRYLSFLVRYNQCTAFLISPVLLCSLSVPFPPSYSVHCLSHIVQHILCNVCPVLSAIPCIIPFCPPNFVDRHLSIVHCLPSFVHYILYVVSHILFTIL